MIRFASSSLTRTVRRAGGVLRALASVPARFALGARGVQSKALPFVSAGLLAASVAQAALPPGTTVTNTATATYQVNGTPLSSSGSATLTTAARTPAQIEFLQYVPTGGSAGSPQQVYPTQCGGNPLPAPLYILPPATPLTVPGVLRLAAATLYSAGDPVFIRVTDYDQNLNPALAETITVSVTSGSGDSETLTLTETGVSSGVFSGYIQSAPAANVANSCVLELPASQTLTASYTDPLDVIATVTDDALVDPFGIVFDSSSGAPIDGARVSLVDAVSNQPATGYCDDGVTLLPQPLTSGSPSVCDAAVQPGGYRFPRVAPGSYRLAIGAPAGYAAPSTVAPAALPGGYVVVGVPGSGASYGGEFPLNPGPAVRIDVPLDPASAGTLEILKTAAKSVVGEGEFVPYALAIRNTGAAAAVAVKVDDRLPAGFRYQAGSARLNQAVLADPAVGADGRTLTFSLGNLAAGATLAVTYVAEVTAAAPTGKAENTAYASGGHSSNTARASVTVREDLMRSRAILMGRVVVGSCDARVDNDDRGLAQARIVLEDGTAILTDEHGRWHADNILPGTHVVQLDLDSLPPEYEAMPCEDNSRFAGRSYSQFVNVRGGSLWRADFHVRKKAAADTAPAIAPVDAAPGAAVLPPAAPVESAGQVDKQLVEQLPYDADWLASAQPGVEWLHPQSDFQPALPAIKLAVKHAPGQRVEFLLNGKPVDAVKFDGTEQNAARSVGLSTWRGVDIEEGDNTLVLRVVDAGGAEVLRETRTLHYSSQPVRVEWVAAQSRLLADGKTQPLIALRFLDKDGHPVRRGINGEFRLNAPYQSSSQLDAIQRDPLAGRIDNRPRYEIGHDGIALIALAPTTQSGEAVLSFDFDHAADNEIRVWLEPGQRDWILVGFAEGTLGHKSLSGNVDALKESGADDDLFDGNRVAFYAKGTVRGDTLLTIAYDTAKQQGNAGAFANLKQAVDPTRFYTLYADSTQPEFDAASSSKLYLKIERRQFYALFGDFDTGLTVTEFARYSRTVNGFKSEFQGERFAYNAFATSTAQAYIRDELRGNGTSGRYRLSRRALIENSDKVRIETRDRFHSEVVLGSRSLTRYLDYDIDYQAGTLFFKSPVPERDAAFNPVYIVAEYESTSDQDEKLTAGGRAAFRPGANSEIGVSLLHDGTVGANGDLGGIDFLYDVSGQTRIQGEFARSRKDAGDADAWKIEAMHHDARIDAKAYLRQQGDGFGLGQQAGSENGTRKLGAEGRIALSETTQLQGQAYRQDTFSTDARRDVVEARAHHVLGTGFSGYYGARYARDAYASGETLTSKQALAGAAYDLLDRRLTLRAATEVGFDDAESVDFPNRLLLGADYRLTAQTLLFAEQEFARGENLSANMTRVGARVQPWTGGELAAALGNQASLDSDRLYTDLGLVQKWQINEFWQTDVAIGRSQTLKRSAPPLNPKVPLASGSLEGDYTSLSLGAHYTHAAWSANSRVEWRDGEFDDKLNLLAGVQRTLDAGRVLAAGFSYLETDALLVDTRSFDARLSYAHRPWDSEWVWLNRLDFIDELSEAAALSTHVRKLVDNSNWNWMPNRHTQIALQFGAKYVLDTLNDSNYRGFTSLVGGEIRRDLDRDWDVGAHAARIDSWNSNVHQTALGVSLGHNLMNNMWIAVGYNFSGFDDADFSGADTRTQGPYLSIRMKVDQDTLSLNDKDGGLFADQPHSSGVSR